jgi:predicted enzyme related to lactoylglutathione lyase
MDRLASVVCSTGDMPGMLWFYESAVGLSVRERAPDRVVFDTAGAVLALHAMPDPARRGVQIRFATDDVDRRVRELTQRGVRFDPGGIETSALGRFAFARDPEDNPIAIWEPESRVSSGAGYALSAVLHCRDLEAQRRFYAEALGFPITNDDPWWVGFDVGEAGLWLHPRLAQVDAARTIMISFSVPDLGEWHEEARDRGLGFVSAPSDHGHGLLADARDPDGNEVRFREAPEPETIEEQLAEPFEESAAPSRGSIRRSTRKVSKAVSRVVIKPAYHGTRQTPRRRPSATTQAVVKVRGGGPDRTRQMPKRTADEKKARVKPAVRRDTKAIIARRGDQKRSAANVSKARPVKRASRPAVAKRTKRTATRKATRAAAPRAAAPRAARATRTARPAAGRGARRGGSSRGGRRG